MAGDTGIETDNAQVERGPRAVAKLGTRVAGESGDMYITISDRV